MRELPAQNLGVPHSTRQGAKPLAAVREDSGLALILEEVREEQAPSLRRFV